VQDQPHLVGQRAAATGAVGSESRLVQFDQVLGWAGAHVVSFGQTSSGITLNSGDSETVVSGGTAFITTVNSGGSLTVSVGGSAVVTTINSGGSLTRGALEPVQDGDRVAMNQQPLPTGVGLPANSGCRYAGFGRRRRSQTGQSIDDVGPGAYSTGVI
jgi:autotransporter passenger strand-loop-strand repeat protein